MRNLNIQYYRNLSHIYKTKIGIKSDKQKNVVKLVIKLVVKLLGILTLWEDSLFLKHYYRTTKVIRPFD